MRLLALCRNKDTRVIDLDSAGLADGLPSAATPSREVVHGDALAWLREHPSGAGVSLITSLPDQAELGVPEPAWHDFTLEAARLCLQAVPPEGIAFFFQTDNRINGRWVSKAGLVFQAAAALAVPVLWHKIVCRRPPGTRLPGRPGYAHLLAFSARAHVPANHATPDVLPELGEQPWNHSMGRAAAEEAVETIRRASPTTTQVVAPFCGTGLALAVANAHGLDAVGIERNRKRSEKARTLSLDG